jgi:hypothetical protein
VGDWIDASPQADVQATVTWTKNKTFLNYAFKVSVPGMDEEWLPLGVFAVIAEPTQTQTDKVVQLAVNKDGVIRGNLQDALADPAPPPEWPGHASLSQGCIILKAR